MGVGILCATAVVWRLRVVEGADSARVFANADLFTYFYPMLEATFGRGGASLLWNPHNGLGMPNLATLQSGLLYPPHLLYRVLPVEFGMGLLVFLHVAFGAAAVVFLMRTLRCAWVSALVGAATFMLSYMLSQISWPSYAEPVPWILLCLAAVERCVVQGKARYAWLLAVSIAMMFLAGGYQAAAYGLFAAGLYTAGALIELARARGIRVALPRAGLALAAALAGLALAAPQLLPTYELAQQGSRVGEGLARHRLQPLGPLYPTLASIADLMLVPPDRFTPGYIGAIALALVPLAALSRHRRVVASCAVIGLWACLNLWSPGWFLDLQSRIPPFGWLRLPERAVLLLHVVVAICTAVGIDAWLRADRPAQSQIGMGIAVVLVAGAAATYRYPGPLWWLPLLLPLTLWPARAQGRRVAQAAAMLLLVVVDLTGATRNPYALPWVTGAMDLMHESRRELRALRELAGPDRVLLSGAGHIRPGFTWNPKISLLGRLDSPEDYEPMAMQRHGDFLNFAAYRETWPEEAIQGFTGGLPWSADPERLALARPFLALMNVRYYAFNQRMYPKQVAGLQQAGLRRLSKVPALARDLPTLMVFEDPRSQPRAYGVYAWSCSRDERAVLERIAEPDFDPSLHTVLDGDCEPTIARSPEPPAPQVVLESADPERVRLRATFTQPGLLILGDSFYPGWTAEVDDSEVPIQRANLLARAVAVPAGGHRIKFEYRPRSFRWGLAIAALTLLLGAAFTAWLAGYRIGTQAAPGPSWAGDHDEGAPRSTGS